VARIRLLAQPLEEGEREAGGLAGAGLGGAEKVAAGEDDGDGLLLDGGGRGVALLCDCAQQFGLEPERFKSANETLSCTAWGKAGASRPVQADANALVILRPRMGGAFSNNGLER
jgi:hypothetical protein